MIVDALYIALGYKPDDKSLKQAEQVLDGVQKGIMKRAAAIGAALAPAAALKAIELLTNAYAAQAIAARDAANAANMDVESLSALGYAAEQAGLRIEDVGGAIGSLRDKIKGATEGSVELTIDFNRIGVSAWRLKKMKPEERLLALADAAQRIKDPMSRAGQALTRLVDPKLLPFLRQGREGIAKMQAEARRLGLVITPEQVKNAEEFSGAQNAIAARFRALKGAVAKELLPILTPLLKRFVELLDKRRIGTLKDAAQFGKDLGTQLASIYATMSKGYTTLEKTVEAFGGLESIFGLMFATLLAITGARGLVALLSMTKALTLANAKAAVASAAAFAPYILAAAAIFLVIGAIDELVGWMEGEETMFTDIFGPATAESMDDIQKMLFGILGVLGLVAAALGFALLGPLIAVGAAVGALIIYWDDLGAAFEAFFDTAISWWGEFSNDVVESVKYVADSIKDAFFGAIDAITERFAALLSWLATQADRVLAPYNAVMGAATRAGARVGGAISSLVGSSSPATAAATRAGSFGSSRTVTQDNEVIINVNGSGLSEAQLRSGVTGGVDDGLRQVQQAYEDGEI